MERMDRHDAACQVTLDIIDDLKQHFTFKVKSKFLFCSRLKSLIIFSNLTREKEFDQIQLEIAGSEGTFVRMRMNDSLGFLASAYLCYWVPFVYNMC